MPPPLLHAARRRIRQAAAGILLAMAAAVCGPGTAATSHALASPQRVAPAIEQAPAAPIEPSPAPPSEPVPPTPAAPASDTPAAAPSLGPPQRSAIAPSADIALVLPLNNPLYARAADAVRAGFLAAAEAAKLAARVVVIGHPNDGVITAFDDARARGVRVIVGPLVRDDLKTVAIAGGEWPTTIALNQLDDGSPLPPNTYSLALTVESDARVLARCALDDGVKAIDIIEGESALMRRLSTAFTGEWMAGGGATPTPYGVTTSPQSLVDLRRALFKALPDAVLLAVDGDRAALVKPFVPAIPAYASGLVFERPFAATARDLDDIRVVDLPWILTPDAPELARLPRRDFGSTALARLYALGLDAFRVALAFVDGAPERLEFDGAIGHVTLDPQRQFQREGRLGIYRGGQLVPLETR